ncbi:MAG TPA: SRPBCC family protein [Streptosporangiaceae bacterium]|jgi:uncharacterized protein YndB with AHSA1/START domain
MIDVTEQINAVRRQVGTRVLEAGEAHTVTISRAYGAAAEDVWDACTSAERIPRWFLPVSGDLRPGGHYQLEGNAEGTIQRCDPPKSFFATWEYGGDVSWIEVRLTAEAAGRTRLEVEHITRAGDERWAQFGPGAVGIGWDMVIMGLSRHLPGAPAMDPESAAAWAGSDEGRRYTKLSGERWCEAHIASGGGEAEARAMAERTIAAYTGAPEEPSA